MTEARTDAPPARTVAARPAPELLPEAPPKAKTATPVNVPAIIVAVVIAAIATLSIYYLVRGEPLLVQGEVDATRLDIAARVDGRVGDVPVVRGQNIDANAVLVRIDNPETLAKHQQALGRQGRRRGAARQHPRRHARRGDCRAQGRARAGTGRPRAGAEDV